MPPEELAQWCQRTLPDDTRAFEALVAQYKDRVFATTYRLTGNYQDAEDMAQEVFVKVFRGIKGLSEPATLSTWIYRIATNTCFDMLERRRRTPQTGPLAAATGDDEAEPRYADEREPTPEASAIQRELRRCLEATLQELDLDARAVLVLRDVEGRSYQEIAETLAAGMSAVKMRIHRARLAFQQLFDRICPGMRRAA
ncbi:MAG: RNA polymerase sigma factor [Thermomicrobiales bacterium]